ncbi:DMT family transporter [Jannaschia pagri]|uniref:DMT family transporter n=1 Tax=Jannaschia pagri TaxID=2829797 RepID=UPI002105A8D1|nr:DMT family transporter [Jannaschia sp. AI_62]
MSGRLTFAQGPSAPGPQAAPEPRDQPRAAIAFMVGATVLIAATTLLAKALGTAALGTALPPLQVTFGRYLFAALAIFAAAAVLRPPMTTRQARWHLARILCGWGGVTLMFASVALIPLAEATAITFLNPIFAMILAIPLLGEQVGRVRWTAAVIALAGAIVLLRPGTGVLEWGALLALGAAVLLGTEVLIIKRLTRHESLLATLVWANGLGLVIAASTALPGWQPPTMAQWAGLAALGLTMAAAQGLFVNAMARADASFITPFGYLTLVFAGLYDAALFDVWLDGLGWVGAALILMGAGLLAWREGQRSKAAKPLAQRPPPPEG